MDERQQFSTFFIDQLFFGVPVENVQEVLRHRVLTRVPLASPIVSGLINLRGQIVTAIDLRRRLGLSEAPEDHHPANVVIRAMEGPVSLLVDEIGEVVEVDSHTFERPPDTLSTEVREFITGVHKLQQRLMHVLDTEKITAVTNEDTHERGVAWRQAGGISR